MNEEAKKKYGPGYHERIRKLIESLPALNNALILHKFKGNFIQYVYDKWIRIYMNKNDQKDSMKEIETVCYEDYDTFMYLVRMEDLSKREQELMCKIGHTILDYGK